MGLFSFLKRKTPAEKAAQNQFKLEKQAQRLEARNERQENRQDGRTDRKESQDSADKVAYQNGMQPVNRAAGIITAGGKAATDVFGAMGGAGVFGSAASVLNTGRGGNRNIALDEDGNITDYSENQNIFTKGGNNMMLILGGVVLFIVVLLTGRRRR